MVSFHEPFDLGDVCIKPTQVVCDHAPHGGILPITEVVGLDGTLVFEVLAPGDQLIQVDLVGAGLGRWLRLEDTTVIGKIRASMAPVLASSPWLRAKASALAGLSRLRLTCFRASLSAAPSPFEETTWMRGLSDQAGRQPVIHSSNSPMVASLSSPMLETRNVVPLIFP